MMEQERQQCSPLSPFSWAFKAHFFRKLFILASASLFFSNFKIPGGNYSAVGFFETLKPPDHRERAAKCTFHLHPYSTRDFAINLTHCHLDRRTICSLTPSEQTMISTEEAQTINLPDPVATLHKSKTI